MPHYIDGTEAKVGDIVRGKPYNTPHEVQGVVVGITPGTDTCNMRVAFAGDLADSYYGSLDVVPPVVGVKIDYAECRAFQLVRCTKEHPSRPEVPYSSPLLAPKLD